MEFKLIIKKLNKTLTSEEKIIFSKWYNESNSHKDYFNSVKKNYKTDLDRIDFEKGWLAIQGDLQITKRKYYWKYAIAASIALLISINFIFNKKENTKVIEPTIVKNNNTIKVGSDKAILTLKDGTNITLEKGQQFVSGNLESNGEEIIYKSKNKSKTEIAYNYLTVPRGGEYYIKLSDGTEVWLNSESQLKYPVSFIDGETRKVELVYGEAYFEVSPSINHKGSKFRVINDAQEVEVIGTEFNIKAYKDEIGVYTTLVEGKVTIDNGVLKQELAPNQQSKISLKDKTLTISSIDVYSEIAWRKGLFSFNSKPLKEIMVVLSRWYDFEVVFANKKLEKVKFNGVLSKKDNIEEILTIIKNANFINAYDITDKKITIK